MNFNLTGKEIIEELLAKVHKEKNNNISDKQPL